MPVLDAVQTFAGIANENEFYSHHYLAEVFKGDIKARLDAWDAAEAEHPGEEAHRAPQQAPAGLGAEVVWPARPDTAHPGARDDAERWQLFTQIQAGLLQALGYDAPAKLARAARVGAGQPIPVWQVQGAKLAVIPAYQPGAETKTCSTTNCRPALRRRARAQRPARRNLGRHAVRRRVRRRGTPALCAAGGPGPLAAAGPLQVAQQPRAAL
jgi:hypothetical protein